MVRIELMDWERACAEASAIRRTVFVVEQGVPEDIELDEHDAHCLHALARDPAGRAIGTGRLLPPEQHGAAAAVGHIGRMAVLRGWRGQGVGSALLEQLVAAAGSRGDAQVALSAQSHALEFYRAHGFVAEGAEYLEAGIPHRAMRRTLQPAKRNS
jgi:predicted GNAT family N-acyltransferase